MGRNLTLALEMRRLSRGEIGAAHGRNRGAPRADGGLLEMVEPLGDRVLLTIRLGDLRLRALTRVRPGVEALTVRIPRERIHWFSAATGDRLAGAA
ncbi:MAG: hypothetical protein ABI768_14845 [Acidobacteriota bacterium]